MATQGFKLPLIYRAVFLFVEPLMALGGFTSCYFSPLWYLQATHAASAPLTDATIPISTSIVLNQLGNQFLLFAFTEGIVLRSTTDLRVWKTIMLGCLISDFGHVYSVHQLGSDYYWKFWEWDSMAFGNTGLSYLIALLRIAFLLEIGLKTRGSASKSVAKES